MLKHNQRRGLFPASLIFGLALLLPTIVSSQTFSLTGSMNTARKGHTATLLQNGKVLVAGGFKGGLLGLIVANAELYDPATGTWSTTVPMGRVRYGHTVTLLPSGKVLVVGGTGYVFLGIIPGAEKSAELYDPVTGAWSPTGEMAAGRSQHTATLLPSGRVLVVGGYNRTPDAPPEIYDPATGRWTLTGLTVARHIAHTATLLPDGKVLVAGGVGPAIDSIDRVELYDPTTGSWRETGSMVTARQLHRATLLPSGKVLVAGGRDTSLAPSASAELYDPASQGWIRTGLLAAGHYGHTATLLPNGKVLLVGGSGFLGGSATEKSAEFYDPAIGIWTVPGNLPRPRYDHTATLLSNGKVLIAGGADNLYSELASAELYNPTAGAGNRVIVVPGIFGTKLVAKDTNTVSWVGLGQLAKSLKSLLDGGFDAYAALQYDDALAPTRPTETAGLMAVVDNPTGKVGDQTSCDVTVPLEEGNVLNPVLGLVSKITTAFDATLCQSHVKIYNSLLDDLTAAGYAVEAFGYDWRADIRTTADDLYRQVKNGAPPVSIVAHSMGGLVVGAMISKHPDVTSLLDKIVTLGTPYDGSVDAYEYLRGWDGFQLGVSGAATAQLGKNWPAAYQLLPRWDFAATGSAQRAYAGVAPIYAVMPSKLRQGAYDLWSGDPMTRLPNAHAIIGSGYNTPAYLRFIPFIFALLCSDVTRPQLDLRNGDGTVPLLSAEASSWNQQRWYVKEEHTRLPGNSDVRTAVKAILAGQPVRLSPEPLPNSAYTRLIMTVVGCVLPLGVQPAYRQSPTPLDSDLPVTLVVKDSSGNVVDSVKRQIQEAQVVQFGSHTVISVLTSGTYSLSLQGRASGTISLVIENASADGTVTAQSIFANLDVLPQSSATVTVSDGRPGNLQFDRLGGGSPQTIGPTTSLVGKSPAFTRAGLTNGASFATGAVAGSIATLFGTNLTTNVSGILGARSTPLPAALGGTSVQVGGITAPLFAVANQQGQEQVNLQIPWELTGQSSAQVLVINNNQVSAPVSVNLSATQPGIFTTDGRTGAILKSDYSTVSAGNPARPGDIVIVFATGLGAVSQTHRTGYPADSAASLTSTLALTIGGVPATVSYAGLAPGYVGLYQVNATVPPNAPSGTAVPLTVSIGGNTSNTATLVITGGGSQ